MKVVAAFDFDKTITNKDTFTSFLFYTAGTWKTLAYFIRLIPAWILYLLGSLGRGEVKEIVCNRFFKGINKSTLEKLGKQFAETEFSKCLNPKAMKKLQWHKDQGHTCILVSASLSYYLRPFANKKFDACLSTQLEFDENNIATGKLKGRNCWGEEKVNRILEHFSGKKPEILFAYGDSRGDREMLELSDYPYYQKFFPLPDAFKSNCD